MQLTDCRSADCAADQPVEKHQDVAANAGSQREAVSAGTGSEEDHRRPTDDEVRVEIADRREIDLGTAANHSVAGVTDPGLIRSCAGVTVDEIGGYRLVVLAHRRRIEGVYF
jgi:hypothetical protein